MVTPILKDDDLCCPNCGIVFDYQKEFISHDNRPSKSNLHLLFLGSALSNKSDYHFNEDRDLRLKENMLFFLNDLCKRYGLPETIAHTVWLILLRKNRGHRSKDNKVALQELVKILSKDDNYLYIHKLRAIKKDYEELLHR
jgi:uncharacterized C2H2 Zn-finger protein